VLIPEANMEKNKVLNLNKAFAKWQEENPNDVIPVPASLKKRLNKPRSDNPSTSNQPNSGSIHNPLNPKGREFLQRKIAEIEDRIIYSGMVNEEAELDLEDSFIDNSSYKRKGSYVLFPLKSFSLMSQ
jgi:hypothetical protein